jgi:hypothetical protein
MPSQYNTYLLKFIGTPNIEFNDTSGETWGAKIDTIIDGAPLSIRENIEEVIMSDDAVDTADGKFRPTTITLTGKVWDATSPKLALSAIMYLRTACYGISVAGQLRVEWKIGGVTDLGLVDHCVSFDYHPTDGMRQIEFEITFTVLKAGL